MEEDKFKIWYDDQPNDVVNKISSCLKKFGLTIDELDGGDGFNEYKIVDVYITKIDKDDNT